MAIGAERSHKLCPLGRRKPSAKSLLHRRTASEPQLCIIDLHREQVLAETHQRIERVYFPHSGIISCVVELIGGGAIETGMIGKDGTFGRAKHSMTRCRSIMS